mmetsp:Transcript_11096/g.21128  ORF Transcript_11096/g.21128 Transcript_11096/m.21128 type:complete len:219 (+) Transcript_11096:52-708(+)
MSEPRHLTACSPPSPECSTWSRLPNQPLELRMRLPATPPLTKDRDFLTAYSGSSASVFTGSPYWYVNCSSEHRPVTATEPSSELEPTNSFLASTHRAVTRLLCTSSRRTSLPSRSIKCTLPRCVPRARTFSPTHKQLAVSAASNAGTDELPPNREYLSHGSTSSVLTCSPFDSISPQAVVVENISLRLKTPRLAHCFYVKWIYFEPSPDIRNMCTMSP